MIKNRLTPIMVGIALTVSLPSLLQAATAHLVGIETPVTIPAQMLQFDIEHRFNDEVDGDIADHFFGLDGGANIDINLEYAINEKASVAVHRISNYKELLFEAAYTLIDEEKFRGSVRLSQFTYRTSILEDKERNVAAIVALQFPELLPKLTPVVNLVYDNYLEDTGYAAGLAYHLSRKWQLMGEYFPTNDRLGDKASYLVGARYATFGHEFRVFFHNNQNIGVRRLLQGTTQSDPSLGFSITRLLSV